MQQIVVFIASPGDVQVERDVAREVIGDINRVIARQKQIHFDVVGWETDSYPAFGADGQQILNKQFGQMTEYDLVVGIMWNRFGTRTPRAESGTAEELQNAVQSFNEHGRPDIMMYFKNELYDFRDQNALEHKSKVLAFKESLPGNCLYAEFTTVDDFRNLFRRHMEHRLATYNLEAPTAPASPHTASTTTVRRHADPGSESDQTRCKNVNGPPIAIRDSGMWVFLDNRYFRSTAVSESEDGSLSIRSESENSDDDAFFKSLRLQPNQRGEPVPYAYRNDGGLARVLSVTADSATKGTIWTLTLRPELFDTGLFSEMAINGNSVDQIAEMRARLLLLNDVPCERGSGSQNRLAALNDVMLLAAVRGLSGRMNVAGSIFPAVWQRFKGQEDLFLPLARLWAIFGLKASATVEHVLELSLGPIQGNMLHVRFRGRRHRQAVNVDPAVIEVEGDCDLTSASALSG